MMTESELCLLPPQALRKIVEVVTRDVDAGMDKRDLLDSVFVAIARVDGTTNVTHKKSRRRSSSAA